MKTDKTILTLKWEGNVFTADLPWDTDMPTLTQAFKGLAIAAGWLNSTVRDYIKTEVDLEETAAKDELITLLKNQIQELSLLSKIELSDDVLQEIERLNAIAYMND
jgi:hypothetical protein